MGPQDYGNGKLLRTNRVGHHGQTSRFHGGKLLIWKEVDMLDSLQKHFTVLISLTWRNDGTLRINHCWRRKDRFIFLILQVVANYQLKICLPVFRIFGLIQKAENL